MKWYLFDNSIGFVVQVISKLSDRASGGHREELYRYVGSHEAKPSRVPNLMEKSIHGDI